MKLHFDETNLMSGLAPLSHCLSLYKFRVWAYCYFAYAPLACYDFDIHKPILIIFGRNVVEKLSNQILLYFLTAPLTNASALPWETGNPNIAPFHLNVVLLCQQTRKAHSVIAWLQLNHSSFAKQSAVRTKQNLGREHHIHRLS